MGSNVDVIVVGGGFAGLIAARDVASAGYSVALLEARARIGGRAYCRPFGNTDERVELGGAWFDAGQQAPIREEAERYGVPVGPATAYQSVRWYTAGCLRTGLPTDRWDVGDLERVIVEAAIQGRSLQDAQPHELESYDKLSVSAWIDRLKPTQATRDFIYGWTSLMTGAHPDDYSILSLLMTVGRMGAYSYYSELANMLPTGTSSLAGAIAGDIRGEVRLGTPVRAIRQTDTHVTVETNTGTVTGSLCILAVPVNTMRQITFDPALDSQRQQALEQGHLCRMTKVWMLATGVPDRMLAAGWGTPFYWLAAERHVADAQLIVAFALQGAIDAQDIGSLERALRDYAPEACVLAADSHDWVNDPWACGGWLTPPRGWASRGVRKLLGTPHGRVLFAGSDVAPEHGGWIAGAIASGRFVAQQAFSTLERP